MSDFNPYRDWLDLEVTDKPTYYQLLGVSPSESDAEEIRHQAKRRIRKIEDVKDSSREALKQRLVTQIKRGAKILLDPKLRKKYDDKLTKAELATPPVVETGAPKVRSVVKIDPKAKRKVSVSQRYKKQTQQRGMVWLCGLLGVISILGICYLVLTQTPFGQSVLGIGNGSVAQSKDVPRESGTTTVREPGLVNDTDVAVLDDPDSAPPRDATPDPVDSRKWDNETETGMPSDSMMENRPTRPTPTADQLREFGSVLSDARAALENQEFAEAKRLLAKAKTMPAREKDHEKRERLSMLTDYASEYWKAVDDALDRLQSGNELTIGERTVMLIEINDRQLVVRSQGQNRTYQRDNLPMWFRVWLADSWFDKNAASTKVFRGAMMAVSSEYSEEEAKKVWQEAERDGADLADLPLVLDDDYDLTK